MVRVDEKRIYEPDTKESTLRLLKVFFSAKYTQKHIHIFHDPIGIPQTKHSRFGTCNQRDVNVNGAHRLPVLSGKALENAIIIRRGARTTALLSRL
jgi:hypothetical protein